MARKSVNQIVTDIIENARATTNDELQSEFEFEAGEQGYDKNEIDAALESAWFPWIN